MDHCQKFALGDLVAFYLHVWSTKVEGKVAKVIHKTIGPYTVLRKVSPGVYLVYRLHFVEGVGH